MPVIPVSAPPPPGLSAVSLDIISSAMRKINVLASGETPTSAEATDALVILNRMIDTWQTQSLLIYNIARQLFTLNPNQQTYTMGQVNGAPPADFNVPRPSRIVSAGIIWLGNPNQPLELPMNMLTTADWALIPVKNISSTIPLNLYDDNAFPYRNLNYYYVPQITIQTALYTWTALSYFNDLSATQYFFPPGYLEALEFNLAVRMAPEFGVTQVSEYLVGMALESLGRVKNSNGQIVDLRCDTALVNPRSVQYDWRSDTPAGPR